MVLESVRCSSDGWGPGAARVGSDGGGWLGPPAGEESNRDRLGANEVRMEVASDSSRSEGRPRRRYFTESM